MKAQKGSFVLLIIWILLFLTNGNFGLMGLLPSSEHTQETVMEDMNMTTNSYHTEIQVQQNNSYLVSEVIQVDFFMPRHGIYRYVPQKGIITEMKEDGTTVDVPYYAQFNDDKIKASAPLELSSDNGNKVFRLGDEEETVYGSQQYTLQYEVAPITSKGYKNAYYNIYPTGWQNDIPEGSTFSITFPEKIKPDSLQIYYGRYGERMNGSDIVSLTWSGNTVSGILKETLSVGTGMAFYVPMEPGYFTDVHTVFSNNVLLIVVSGIAGIVLIVLFFIFGKDKAIIPSIQFHPPKGLDSAAVGYIVDGNVSDTDIVSLILYWASQGYIKILETGKSTLAFRKVKKLPNYVPAYESTLFDAIFGQHAPIGKEVPLSSLRYKTAEAFLKTRQQIAEEYSNKIYTKGSKIARTVSIILSCIPLFMFTVCLIKYTTINILVLILPILYVTAMLLFNRTVDYWYSKAKNLRLFSGSISVAIGVTALAAFLIVYGGGMLKGKILNFLPGLLAATIVSLIGIPLTGFMRKRTDACIEWMGYLAGLRDFIETAELERMEVIAQESPHLFYHILPFAYVFGLTDILLDKMKDLTLPAPEWYETQSGSMPCFDFYLMRRIVHTDMRQAVNTISTPKPAESSGSSSGGFSGGGFSGGGFGGGGGGSW